MRHAEPAKPEVTEAAIIGLPVQSVKMSIKAPTYSQPNLKTACMVVELGSYFSQYSRSIQVHAGLSSPLQSQPSKPDVVSKSLGTFVNQILTNQIA